jgi:ribonuclease P protein component
MEHRTDSPGSPGEPRSRARFSRTHRLHRLWQYRRAYDSGRSARGAHVNAYAHVAAGEPSRAGIVASKKVGPAVTRNRAKRRLRAVVRELWPDVRPDGVQVVLIALPSAPTVDFERLKSDVRVLLHRLGALEP